MVNIALKKLKFNFRPKEKQILEANCRFNLPDECIKRTVSPHATYCVIRIKDNWYACSCEKE